MTKKSETIYREKKREVRNNWKSDKQTMYVATKINEQKKMKKSYYYYNSYMINKEVNDRQVSYNYNNYCICSVTEKNKHTKIK